MALAKGSLYHGSGIIDKALHSGLLVAGVASFIQVGVELDSNYLDASLRNNPELWTEESIAINTDIRDLTLSGDVPQLDCVVAGIPCTGASRSGRSKNKIQNAEEHSSAGTLFIDFLDFVKASNPAICIIENVPEYLDSVSMTVIRSVLTSLVRIPRHLDTQPTIIWTLVPCSLGHLIHVHLDRQSERSDAGLHC